MLICFAGFELIKRGVECDSSDTKLGKVRNVYTCAHLCEIKPGCKYFIVGNNGGWEKCYQEHTHTHTCPEGWDLDTYDFYQLKGILYKLCKYVLQIHF